MDKVEKIKEVFRSIDPSQELYVEDDGEGNSMVYGPFPTFIIFVDRDVNVPIRALVHVNADAPNLVLFFAKFMQELDIILDGPFAVDGETGQLLLGNDAYSKKEENILAFASEIMQKRMAANKPSEGLIVPEEKKIILV